MSAATLAEMYRPATASGPTCGPSGRSTAVCATEASRDSSTSRSACAARTVPATAAIAVAAMMKPIWTAHGMVRPCGYDPKATPIAVASPPTTSTSRHAAKVATRNGAEASSPM